MPSAAVTAALLAQETDEGFVTLLTFTHAQWGQPYRFCNHRDGFTSRGDSYLYFPYSLPFMQMDPDRPPSVQLSISNIDRRIVEAVRTVSTPPTVTFEVVTVSEPDTVEYGPMAYTMGSPDGDLFTVTSELGFEDILNAAANKGTFRPSSNPGLFQ